MLGINGWKRTALIVFLYFIAISIHSSLLALGEARPQCAESPPLYDISHDLGARGHWFFSNLHLINHDIIVYALMGMLFILFWRHPQRELLFRRFIFFHGVIALIRGTLIIVTTIPSPTSLCRDRYMDAADVFGRAVTITLKVIGIPPDWHPWGPDGVTCCDIIISGHTSMLVVTTSVICFALSNKKLRTAIWALTSIGLAGTVTVDRHYTVDMLVTLLIGLLVINLYEQLAIHSHKRVVGFFEERSLFPNGIQKFSIKELFTRKT